jgi:hypothetical protein
MRFAQVTAELAQVRSVLLDFCMDTGYRPACTKCNGTGLQSFQIDHSDTMDYSDWQTHPYTCGSLDSPTAPVVDLLTPLLSLPLEQQEARRRWYATDKLAWAASHPNANPECRVVHPELGPSINPAPYAIDTRENIIERLEGALGFMKTFNRGVRVKVYTKTKGVLEGFVFWSGMPSAYGYRARYEKPTLRIGVELHPSKERKFFAGDICEVVAVEGMRNYALGGNVNDKLLDLANKARLLEIEAAQTLNHRHWIVLKLKAVADALLWNAKNKDDGRGCWCTDPSCKRHHFTKGEQRDGH